MPNLAIFRYQKPEVSPREDIEGFVKGARSYIKDNVKKITDLIFSQ